MKRESQAEFFQNLLSELKSLYFQIIGLTLAKNGTKTLHLRCNFRLNKIHFHQNTLFDNRVQSLTKLQEFSYSVFLPQIIWPAQALLLLNRVSKAHAELAINFRDLLFKPRCKSCNPVNCNHKSCKIPISLRWPSIMLSLRESAWCTFLLTFFRCFTFGSAIKEEEKNSF